MSEYIISEIKKNDSRNRKKQIDLLKQEGIDIDDNLDYSVGLFDEDYRMVATGSCFDNTLRCMAVDSACQGEGLMNQVVTHLVSYQHDRGKKDLFLYTKINSAKFFGDLGFYEIARVNDRLVFMENRKTGFADYINELKESRREGRCAAIVMNANPFTKGHRYLVEKAASENDFLHLFVVSEDRSEVSFSDRFSLVKQGTSHLNNVIVHETKSYMISSATFPSYFLKEEAIVAESHARLDIAVFVKIAEALNISRRYVGKEPFSQVTALYNEVMKKELPNHNIECTEIDRLENSGDIISATKVRDALHRGDLPFIKNYVPETTYEYLADRIRQNALSELSENETVDVMDMTNAREERVLKQQEILNKLIKDQCLLCFNLNIAGPVKRFALEETGFLKGTDRVRQALKEANIDILNEEITDEKTGHTGYFALNASPVRVKEVMTALEEESPVGRLYDLDVLGLSETGYPEKVSRATVGRGDRTCLICGGPVINCSRSRAHTVKDLQEKTVDLLMEMEK